jgi:hypothetical protein
MTSWPWERDVARDAFACGRFGPADLIYVSDVDDATLRARREGDATRARRCFARHVKLRDSLLDWYRSIDSLEPGFVVFGLPETGIADERLALGPRCERSGARLFDALVARLASD